MPVVETTPPVTARPCSCVSRLNSPQVTPPCARTVRLWIDVNALHRRQVDHQPAIDGRAPCHVVTAATNRHLEAELAREIDGIDDVGHAAASGNQCRALVDQTVVDLPRVLVARVRRLQELAREGGGKFGAALATDAIDDMACSPRLACHVFFHLGRARSKREEFSPG